MTHVGDIEVGAIANPSGPSPTTTPLDGKRALATKFDAHKITLLDVNGHKVIDSRPDLPTGQWPFNVAVVPGGRIALSADSGDPAGSDGSVDTVSVIDLEAMPPRIIDPLDPQHRQGSIAVVEIGILHV